MRDFSQSFTNLDQRASGTITVDDYTQLALDTITVGVDVVTEGTDFNAVTDNDTTAANIASAIDALGLYSASATGNVVTVYQTLAGSDGNSKALASSAEGAGVTLSGNFLAGGVDFTVSDTFDISQEDNFDFVDVIVNLTSISTGSLNITPVVSLDNISYFDRSNFPEMTAAGMREFSVISTKLYIFLIIVASQEPVTFDVKMATQRGEPKYNGFGEGLITLAATGVAEPLSAETQIVRNLTVQALTSNLNGIFIGGPNVIKDNTGNELQPLADKHYPGPVDLKDVYITGTSGEGVMFEYAI